MQRAVLQRKSWQRYTDELFSRVHSLEEDLQKEQRHRRRDQNVATSHCTQVELEAEAKVSELHAHDPSKQQSEFGRARFDSSASGQCRHADCKPDICNQRVAGLQVSMQLVR